MVVGAPVFVGQLPADAYQPAERKLDITGSVIEMLSEHHHRWSLLTESAGVEDDLGPIAPMAQRNLAAVDVVITTQGWPWQGWRNPGPRHPSGAWPRSAGRHSRQVCR